MSIIKVLIISDGHGALDQLDALEPVFKESDMVLFGGDFAEFGKPETGLPFLERLAKMHDRIFSVTGNCDALDFKEVVESYDISIEASFSYFNGLVMAGSGGASPFGGVTPNERSHEDLVSDLTLVAENSGTTDIGSEKSVDDSMWDSLILITHNPPKDTTCDLISSGVHVGSPLIREFVEKYRPLLLVCGHIHESAGIDSIGSSVIVNPGSLLTGNYAMAEISGGGKEPFAIQKIELKTISQ